MVVQSETFCVETESAKRLSGSSAYSMRRLKRQALNSRRVRGLSFSLSLSLLEKLLAFHSFALFLPLISSFSIFIVACQFLEV